VRRRDFLSTLVGLALVLATGILTPAAAADEEQLTAVKAQQPPAPVKPAELTKPAAAEEAKKAAVPEKAKQPAAPAKPAELTKPAAAEQAKKAAASEKAKQPAAPAKAADEEHKEEDEQED
jgi:outer membrane biosynthesis protein TonB